jgi:acetolactate synthase-1/2/3 large subunit
MDAVQQHVVDGSDSRPARRVRQLVLVDDAPPAVRATAPLPRQHGLRAHGPCRAGSSARRSAGGARGRVVGDGAMLMTNEINSAVKDGARAVWIVLNDARYGMCAQGMATLGFHRRRRLSRASTSPPSRGRRAAAGRVDCEPQLDEALAAANGGDGPFVVDVRIDRASLAPASRRNAALCRGAHHSPAERR